MNRSDDWRWNWRRQRQKSYSIEFVLLIFCSIELWIIIVHNKLLFVLSSTNVLSTVQWHFKHELEVQFVELLVCRPIIAHTAIQSEWKSMKLLQRREMITFFWLKFSTMKWLNQQCEQFWEIFQQVAHHHHHWSFSSRKHWLIERTPRIAFHQPHHSSLCRIKARSIFFHFMPLINLTANIHNNNHRHFFLFNPSPKSISNANEKCSCYLLWYIFHSFFKNQMKKKSQHFLRYL